MASRRRETVIFRIDKKLWKKRIEKYHVTLTLVISASGEARYFFQKSKLIYIEKSKRWAQSGFCSFRNGKQKSRPVLKIIGLQKL